MANYVHACFMYITLLALTFMVLTRQFAEELREEEKEMRGER